LGQIAFKQLTRIGEVLLGIGDRRRDPLERFVENGDDALLFGDWGKRDRNIPHFCLIKLRDR